MNVSALSQQTVAEQRSHEPSMEEILASIRRIIADDHVLPLSRQAQTQPPARQPQAEPPRVQAVHQDAYHDAYDDYQPAPPAPRVQPVRPAAPMRPPQAPVQREAAPQRVLRPAFRMEEPAPRMAPEPMRYEAPPMAYEEVHETTMLSNDADASVSSSFNALATSVMLQNNGLIEDSVREMLRPMLKSWLDDNLPGIVERLVRQEIERMSRTRR